MSAHFTPKLFKFLRDLKRHNDREWFAANRDRFVAEVEGPMLQFIGDFAPRLRAISRAYVADRRRTVTHAVVFVSVLLAELGDKTQLATMLFASDTALSRWGVLAAAAGALTVSTALAVLAGTLLGAWLSPRHLKLAAGVGFVAIGAWILVRA